MSALVRSACISGNCPSCPKCADHESERNDARERRERTTRPPTAKQNENRSRSEHYLAGGNERETAGGECGGDEKDPVHAHTGEHSTYQTAPGPFLGISAAPSCPRQFPPCP